MPEPQTPSGQRFELLYRISQAFNTSLEIIEIFDRVIVEVIQAIRAQRGYVITRQPNGELSIRVARCVTGETLNLDELQFSTGIVNQVIDQSEAALSLDAIHDSRYQKQNSVVDLQLKSILCVPLKCKSGMQGVIYVENRADKAAFSERELELLVAIAANAAVAIDNAQNFSELQEQLKNINLLYEISADLTSRLDLDQLLTATLQRVKEVLQAPAASILTVEGENLVFQVALGEKSDQIKPFQIPMDQSIAGWVVQNQQGLIVNDARNDARFFQGTDSQTGFVTESIIAAPLLTKNDAIGVIELFNKVGGFSQRDLELLTAIASNAAIAIENARLYQAAVEKGRMERELQMALSVQTGLLPERTPQLAGWDFAAYWHPARQVSGDFYDFIRLSEASHTLFGNQPAWGMLIADVTDKGMPAALFMAFTRSIIRASMHQVSSPAEGITQANQLICEDSAHGLFVTMFYGQINPLTGDMIYVNAGHNPPLLYRAASQTLERLMPTGIPVGIVEDFKYQQSRVTLEIGDFMICYTDGVTEAVNTAEEEFGMERLETVTLANSATTAEALAADVAQTVFDFSPAGKQFDDITVMVIKRTNQ